MTLEKAIERLTLEITVNLDSGAEDFNAACKLGIEALKRLNDNRRTPHYLLHKLLPGETKD